MKKIILCLAISVSNLLIACSEQDLHFIGQFVKSDGFVFDVGAHKGVKTDVYLLLNARVLCIEPQVDCVDFLREKYADNPSVSILNKGLSDSIGIMQLHICDSASTISTFSKEWQHGRFSSYSWDNTINVEMTTLDELIKEFGMPNFCKIDVEGFEYQVLKGLSSSTIPCISFEFTYEFFDNSVRCMQHLQALGYTSFNFVIGESAEMALSEWGPAEEVIKNIKNSPDPLIWGDIYARYQ